MPTTPGGLPYPSGSDPVANGAQDIQDLAEAVDAFPGLRLVKTQTIGTNVTSVVVADAFSSAYENYKIMVSGGVASTSTDVRLQLGSTTTAYYCAYSRVSYSGATAALASDNNGANFSRAGFATTDSFISSFDLLQPFLAKRTIYDGVFVAHGSGFSAGSASGFVDSNTSYTGFTFIMPTGNLTGGAVRVYGYRI